jgi:S-formylglutathione hydrolase FrmB
MNANKRYFLIIITLLILVVIVISAFVLIPAFSEKNSSKVSNDSISKKDTIKIDRTKNPKTDTVITINNRNVYLKAAVKKTRGVFLVLHGWNLPAEEWCTKTDLCSKATALGFFVVLPDMGLSVYQDQDYDETRSNWRTYPTRSWLCDTLIPLLRKNYGLLLENDSNYIVGLSTGARGVALVLLDFPELFKGAAALSGDYDQYQLPNDNLTTGYYGSFTAYNERWKTIDNPVYRIKEYKTPIFLGHGTEDKVVPISQTYEFYDSLKKYNPSLPIKLSTPAAGHNYDYWSSEVDPIMKFFGLK